MALLKMKFPETFEGTLRINVVCISFRIFLLKRLKAKKVEEMFILF